MVRYVTVVHLSGHGLLCPHARERSSVPSSTCPHCVSSSRDSCLTVKERKSCSVCVCELEELQDAQTPFTEERALASSSSLLRNNNIPPGRRPHSGRRMISPESERASGWRNRLSAAATDLSTGFSARFLAGFLVGSAVWVGRSVGRSVAWSLARSLDGLCNLARQIGPRPLSGKIQSRECEQSGQ